MVRFARFLASLTLLALAACASPTPGQEYIVFFDRDDTTLTPEGQQVVAAIVKTIHETHPSRVTVQGNSDGGAAHDAEIATLRGQAVAQALIADGIDPNRVAELPGAPPPDAKGIAARKVVVTLLK